MRNIWDRALLLCYNGMDRRDYQRLSDRIREQNQIFTRRVDIFAIFMMSVMLVSNLVTDYVSMMVPTCIIFLAAYFLEYTIRFFCRRRGIQGNVNAHIWFSMSKYFLFSYFSGIFFNESATAFTFYIFLMALPMLFIQPTWCMALYVTIVCAVFSVLVLNFKTPEIAVGDLYYAAICYLCTISISYWFNSVRLISIQNEMLLIIQRDTDVLTGLYNRLCFNSHIARAFAPDGNLEIYMIDVDFFKSYNDHFGHLVGDDILRRLGACFREFAVEHGLFFARYGGEEFVAVGAGKSPEQAELLAGRLLESVRGLAAPHPYSGKGTLTISIGVACQKPDCASYMDLLNHADKALYRAKADGRDCVRSD